MAICFYNGKYQADEESHIAITDRGYTLGDGLFETLPIIAGNIIALKAHLTRLSHSAKKIALLLPDFLLNYDKVEIILKKLMALNHYHSHLTLAIRITISRASTKRGLAFTTDPVTPYQTNTLITITPYTINHKPKRLHLDDDAIRYSNSCLTTHKTLSYLPNILLQHQAQLLGFDDGIYINEYKHICATSCANIFLLINGKILTPTISSGILAGITRALLIQLLKEKQQIILETEISKRQLLNADAVFITNSLHGIMPVSAVDNRQFTNELVERYLEKLKKQFIESVWQQINLQKVAQ